MSTVHIMEEIMDEVAYVIDWAHIDGINRTTHPLYIDNPPYGSPPVNRIWLDGIEISDQSIRCLMTGPSGWVEIIHRYPDNTPVCEIYNNWDQVWEEMTDEWKANHKFQIKSPHQTLPKYGEDRIKVSTHKGNVVWKYTPKP